MKRGWRNVSIIMGVLAVFSILYYIFSPFLDYNQFRRGYGIRRGTVRMKLIDVATRESIQGKKVKIISDNGIVCGLAESCPGEAETWEGISDEKGIVMVSSRKIVGPPLIKVDGYFWGSLLKDGKLVWPNDWEVTLSTSELFRNNYACTKDTDCIATRELGQGDTECVMICRQSVINQEEAARRKALCIEDDVWRSYQPDCWGLDPLIAPRCEQGVCVATKVPFNEEAIPQEQPEQQPAQFYTTRITGDNIDEPQMQAPIYSPEEVVLTPYPCRHEGYCSPIYFRGDRCEPLCAGEIVNKEEWSARAAWFVANCGKPWMDAVGSCPAGSVKKKRLACIEGKCAMIIGTSNNK